MYKAYYENHKSLKIHCSLSASERFDPGLINAGLTAFCALFLSYPYNECERKG